jgi:hypothetical protein
VSVHACYLFSPCISSQTFLSSVQYYAGHEIFLDGQSAVFVVVVRLDEVAEERERQLRYWLRFIKGRMMDKPARDSRPAVVVVGSKRDAAGEDVRQQDGSKEWTSAWGSDQLRLVSYVMFVCFV